MSQGMIVRKKAIEEKRVVLSDKLLEDRGTVKCNYSGCGEEFTIYHHRAHIENPEEQAEWLQKALKNDHSRLAKHADSYEYPL